MSPSAGAHVPLLTGTTNSAVEPGSVPGAVFNVATTIIGAGIMSIPAILKVLGVFPSFALILIVAVLAEVSVEFLLRFTHAGETTTYSGVMREAFGSYGAISVQVCVIVTNFGALILYLIIIG
jgi:amino acid permease